MTTVNKLHIMILHANAVKNTRYVEAKCTSCAFQRIY